MRPALLMLALVAHATATSSGSGGGSIVFQGASADYRATVKSTCTAEPAVKFLKLPSHAVASSGGIMTVHSGLYPVGCTSRASEPKFMEYNMRGVGSQCELSIYYSNGLQACAFYTTAATLGGANYGTKTSCYPACTA